MIIPTVKRRMPIPRLMRHGMTWVLVAVFLLAQVVAGISGPDTHLCICSVEVSLEQQNDSCCSETTATADGGSTQVVVAGCSHCLLIPLPDPAPTTLPIGFLAVVPASPVPVAMLSWPPIAVPSRHRDQERSPPHLHLRHLRSIVLTC
ncbi:MAG: hypothetical protein AAB263_04405 [Planctomycetota bacterium]